jgi:uncharacterized membrane protein (DUF373 family)
MATRHAVLTLVVVVTLVMGVRGIVAVLDGDVGTLLRQVAVGGILLAFGVGLFKQWDDLG